MTISTPERSLYLKKKNDNIEIEKVDEFFEDIYDKGNFIYVESIQEEFLIISKEIN